MNKLILTAACTVCLCINAQARVLPIPNANALLRHLNAVKAVPKSAEPQSQPKIITSNVIQIVVVNCQETVMNATASPEVVRK